MTKKNEFAKLFNKDEYAQLTRDGMYQALLHVSPTLAKGQSRAKKEVLQELYARAAQSDSIPTMKIEQTEDGVTAVPAGPPEVKELDGARMAEANRSVDEAMFRAQTEPQVQYIDPAQDLAAHGELPPTGEPVMPNVDYAELESRVAIGVDMASGPDQTATVSAPLPQMAGLEDLDEFVRANPPMPELRDGDVYMLPPEQQQGDPLFTFRGEARELTDKEKRLIESLKKNFEVFRNNPAHTDAKRAVLADIYALKTCGIIANPLFVTRIKEGRAMVREARAKFRAGVDMSEIAKSEKPATEAPAPTGHLEQPSLTERVLPQEP